MDLILLIFERIFFYIKLFFFATQPYTYIFKIALLAQIIFLVYSTRRPSKQNWKNLFISEALYLAGGAVVWLITSLSGNIFSSAYGIMCIIVAVIMLYITMHCSEREPKSEPNDA